MGINISKRFEELIKRGENLFEKTYSEKDMTAYYPSDIKDQIFSDFVAWKLSAKNILRQVYGKDSENYNLFNNVFGQFGERDKVQYCTENTSQALGILRSAQEEFDLGLTDEITHILAIEFFDGVLDQAKELLTKGLKDPAVILGRIIIEDTLKDLCKRNGINFSDSEGASSINEKLKEAKVFTLPQFKLCRTNIELGNDGAHGDFDKYSYDDVNKMFEYIENSLLVF